MVRELDRYDSNNERRHAEHRDGLDTTLVDRGYGWDSKYESPPLRVADCLKLSCSEDWVEIIFTQKAEDIHQLAEAKDASLALLELNQPQKEVLLENVIHRKDAKELAQKEGCSVRNITKRRKAALDNVRRQLTK